MSISVGGLGVTVQQNDVIRIVQPLVAGNNVIVDNAGFTARQIETRDNVTGAVLNLRVVAESTNSFTLFVPVEPLNPVRISIDV
jgi:hypothetical protein